MSKSVKIVKPSGIIDGMTSANLRSEIETLLAQGTKHILVDFSAVTFMNSSGLGALVAILKKVRLNDGNLYICSLNEQVKMIFSLTKMDSVFTICDNQLDFNKKFTS
jgi:anti-anti-sigma factor